MKVAVTGTPGTGKSTATELLETDLEVIHLNEVIEACGLHEGCDEERDSTIADVDAIRDWLGERDDYVLESHLAHHLPADVVVVLRCHPDELRERLEERGDPEAKVDENAEAEALDLVLTEAVSRHGTDRVHEIDTTDRSPAAVAGEVEASIAGERSPSVGTVSFLDGP